MNGSIPGNGDFIAQPSVEPTRPALSLPEASRASSQRHPVRQRTMILGPGPANRRPGPLVLPGMSDTVTMDAHTLELLEFGKVRDLLAGYAACSLGKELAS